MILGLWCSKDKYPNNTFKKMSPSRNLEQFHVGRANEAASAQGGKVNLLS